MIYNCMGNGSKLENNIMRIKYVENMESRRIDYLVNRLVFAIQFEDKHEMNNCIEKLFYESVSINVINRLCVLYNLLPDNDKLYVKEKIIGKCINYSKKGFYWNCYNVINTQYKSHKFN